MLANLYYFESDRNNSKYFLVVVVRIHADEDKAFEYDRITYFRIHTQPQWSDL